MPSRAGSCCRLLIICLLLACVSLPTAGQTKCAKRISNCKCETTSGKYIDLSPLTRSDDYRFKKVMGPNLNWLYSYNPCIGFKCQGAENVAVCQNEKDGGPQEFALGTQDTAEFGYTEAVGLHLKYTSAHTSTTRVSLVSLVCSQTGADEFTPLDDGTGDPDVTYLSRLTSKYACEVDRLPVENGAGLSAGDILLIVFFVGCFVYVTGGFAVNALALKKGFGPAAVPNAAFWLALPGYVRDGAAFSLARLRQLFSPRRSGYEGV